MSMPAREKRALRMTARAIDSLELSIVEAARIIRVEWTRRPSALCPRDRRTLLEAGRSLDEAILQLSGLRLREQLKEDRQ